MGYIARALTVQNSIRAGATRNTTYGPYSRPTFVWISVALSSTTNNQARLRVGPDPDTLGQYLEMGRQDSGTPRQGFYATLVPSGHSVRLNDPGNHATVNIWSESEV